ncbi:MAG: hypothetical protein L6408_07115 [Nanoarchaeota archaeon]|nr:hypothetical protein [Nanoarchaeota archaeon]
MKLPKSFIAKNSEKKMEEILEGKSEINKNTLVRRHKDNLGLEGYDLQVCFDKLEDITGALGNAGSFNGADLIGIGEAIGGYVGRSRMVTDDNYTWFWGLQFERYSEKLAILVPWGKTGSFEEIKAVSSSDNIKLERSVVAFASESLYQEDVDIILEEFYQGVLKIKY